MVVEIQCRNVAYFERTTTLKLIRLFCGFRICQNEFEEREEHPLFIALNDDAFGILNLFSLSDEYSSCLGLFMNYFQNENECPTVNGEKICYKSQYIKVGFYGGTSKTLKKVDVVSMQ